MNIPVYLGILILELSKMLMYQCWFDYVKPEYGKKPKLFYMATNSFIVYIKTDDIYKDVAKDVETRFDTSNYKLERPLPKGKNKKGIGLTKDELDKKIMTKFVGLRAKTYSYVIDNGNEDKKAKRTEKCVIKRKFRNYQNPIVLFKDLRDGNTNPKEVLKGQIKFKSDLIQRKKGNPKSESKDQISVIQNIEFFFFFFFFFFF